MDLASFEISYQICVNSDAFRIPSTMWSSQGAPCEIILIILNYYIKINVKYLINVLIDFLLVAF